MKRLIAVGDVHGCRTALAGLLREIKPSATDLIVMLGDYIDRGPDSRGVLDDLLDLAGRCQLIALRGNHEQLMRGSRFSRETWETWISNGGRQALASFGTESKRGGLSRSIPSKYWKLLDSQMQDFFETEHFLFVHAGAEPHLPLAEQSPDTLFWMLFDRIQPHQSGKRIVCGHTAASDVRMLKHVCCLDTAMGKDPSGLLSGLDLTNRVLYQSTIHGWTKAQRL